MRRSLRLEACLLSLVFATAGFGLVIAETKQRQDKRSDEIMRAMGAQIYSTRCIKCHGGEGQGTEKFYRDALMGDSTVGELTALIANTMPEEDPDECVAEDARAVAMFIHHEFYGEAAQLRRRPPRKVLTRLTAEQLRQSLADLYGRFGPPASLDERKGLDGTYFDGDRWKKEKIKIKRVDPVIDFDFDHDGPGSGINPKEYYIHWEGALKVPVTGRYEIIVRSTCSFTMDFGHKKRQLIDNHVQSEGKEEFRETLLLTGGRSYPINIDCHQRKRKTEQPPGQISISWIPPWGAEEIIPVEFWSPSPQPATLSLQTKLPPDDRSYGYERGTAVSRSWDDSTTAAAIEFAGYASSELYPEYLRRHKRDNDQDRARLRGFLYKLVETAFRKPLDEPMKHHFVDRFVDEIQDDAEAIKIVSLYTIKSPRFLYPSLDADRSASRRSASRLALTLFDSLPSDSWLAKMAEKGQLDKPERIRRAAVRMVEDPRCRAKTLRFIHHWFDLGDLNEITKNQELYPGYDKNLVADLHESFNGFVEEVVYGETSDFRQLLQAEWGLTNQRIADFYGDAWKPSEDLSKEKPLVRSVSDRLQHVGLLTHPLLMSELAYQKTTSPIHRGVFLTRYTLGRVLRPPNAAFTPLSSDLHPGLTTRQRVQLQTGEVNCQVCHSKINALGFALEQFDAAGRYRVTENNQTIDVRGSYINREGETTKFNGARELGDFLANSEDCQRSFVETAFEHFVKQPIAAFGAQRSDELTESFRQSGCNIKQLIVSIAEIAAVDLPPMPSNTDA